MNDKAANSTVESLENMTMRVHYDATIPSALLICGDEGDNTGGVDWVERSVLFQNKIGTSLRCFRLPAYQPA